MPKDMEKVQGVQVGDVIAIDRANPNDFDGKCELCKKEDELRPYGPNGEWICFDCMMKDEESAKRQFSRLVLGEPIN